MDAVDDDTSKTRTSTRDPADLHHRLSAWFEQRLPPDSRPVLHSWRQPAKAGMSSETLLFDMTWLEGGTERTGSFVARLPPPVDACPLFPVYDFDRQIAVMRLVGSRSRVPVPAVPWQETDASAIGVPFFVMTRSVGEVVADHPPYTLAGWLRDADEDQLASVQRELVGVIAGVHGVEATAQETAFLQRGSTGATPMQRHFAHEREYYEWGRSGLRFPLVERLFDWLEAHWPAEQGAAVVCWGDARPGNILWHDWKASAVLDWEEATLAPRELDVGYTIFFHQYFRHVERLMSGSDTMSRFLRRADVVAAYEGLTGVQLRDIDWYIAYGLLRQSLVEIRISQRRILFGEMPRPADTNEYLYARPLIERVLSGAPDPWGQ